jgi:hypothetical protein
MFKNIQPSNSNLHWICRALWYLMQCWFSCFCFWNTYESHIINIVRLQWRIHLGMGTPPHPLPRKKPYRHTRWYFVTSNYASNSLRNFIANIILKHFAKLHNLTQVFKMILKFHFLNLISFGQLVNTLLTSDHVTCHRSLYL